MGNEYLPEGFIPANADGKYSDGIGGLERALEDGAILEGTAVLCDSALNLHIEINGCDGIIPRSEAAMLREGEVQKDVAIITRVGKSVCFKITEIQRTASGTRILLSRRLAQEECFNNYVSNLTPGDIIRAKVTHLESFGAFCDIGCGIISLLPVDCISVSRISHPSDRLFAGMQIYAIVKTADRESSRITLGMRELLGTWAENAAVFRPGQTVAGIIRSVESYGIFVELAPNLAGLAEAHGLDRCFTELPGLPHPAIGKTAAVFIKSINPERMKIKLSVVDAAGDIRKNQIHCGRNPSAVLKYYIDFDTVRHIDKWRYSPAESIRTVESNFG